MPNKHFISLSKWQYFALLLTLLLTAFLYVKSQGVATEVHEKISASNQSLKNTDNAIKASIFEIRFGTQINFDTVVFQTKKLSKQLKNHLEGLDEKTTSTLTPIIVELAEAVTKRQQDIEGYKSHIALFKNSARYWPYLSQEFKAKLNDYPEQKIPLTQLVNETLLTVVNSDFNFQGHSEQAIKNLYKAKTNVPNELINTFNMLIIHGEHYIDTRNETHSLMINIMNSNASQQINRLTDTYRNYYLQEEITAKRYQQGLIFIIIIMVLTISYVLYRMAMVTVKLEKTVRSLDFQKYALDQHAIVSIANVKGNITYVNELFCNISKYSNKELVGKNHRIVKSDEHDKAFFEKMWRTISSGNVWHGEIKNYAKDGSIYWVSSTIVPFMDEANKPFQYVSIRTDITERKRQQLELADAVINAEQANAAKSSFLANMSHEIRTPMNAIIGMSYLALQTELNEQQKDYINKVNTSAKALLELLNDILDFSKIEANKLDIESRHFLMKDVLTGVTDLLTLPAKEKGLKLSIQLDTEIPLALIGDGLRLRQCLVNFVSNAIKFTEHGEVIVKISHVENINDIITINFSVHDTGIGMTEIQKGNLFEAFSQADISTTRKYGGTGLGLTITSQLVELMGGKIKVKTKLGEGSIFSFNLSLPISHQTIKKVDVLPTSSVKDKSVKQPTINITQPQDPHQNENEFDKLKGLHILLVEDNLLNQELARSLLEMYAMIVDIAENGLEAIELFERNTYDCILMDCQMPVMDGYTASKEIRKKHSASIPILALTANVMTEDVEKAINAGMNDVIAKPIDIDTMLATIEKWAVK